MTSLIEAAGVVLIPCAGLLALLAIGGAVSWAIDVYNGDAELPKLPKRHKKSPRKAATSRGMVGQKLRRPLKNSYIVAQTSRDVKGEYEIAVVWNWYRR